MLWPIALITFFAFYSQTQSQYASECLLPNQQLGRCLPVVSCKPLHDLFHPDLSCGHIDNVPHACCSASDTQLNPEGLGILQNQGCGLLSRGISSGAEIKISAFPWTALLKYNDQKDPYQCGGALISEQYVLTAAHCIKENLYQVRLGEHRINTNPDCNADGCAPPVEDVDIEETRVHESYKNGFIGNDIALIRLKQKMVYKSHIKPICLPIYDNLRAYEPRHNYISGWGKTENASSSNVLLAARLPLVGRDECKQILRIHHPLTYASICAGNINLADGCAGDSGAPLAYKGTYSGQKRFVQLGILATGTDGCGKINAPSIYTNISHYMQWVTDKIKQ